jgi:GT2 family glycosyltransferase
MKVAGRWTPRIPTSRLRPLAGTAEPAGVWIGLAELGSESPVTAVSGPPRPDQELARVLVRMHGAPLGYVSLPLRPEATLAERVRNAAESSVAESLERHLRRDTAADTASASPDWGGQVGCPARFSHDAAGISIVVCTRDRPDVLQECLRALMLVSYTPLEILVVDNAPTGDITKKVVSELAEEDSRIRYTCEPQPGLSRARNHGMAVAKFDLVAFTDDDVLVDAGWPAALAAGFAADPDAACMTGLVASRSLDTRAEFYFDSRYSWGEAFTPRRYDLGPHRDSSAIYPFSAGIFGTGANFAVRRPEIDRLGGFDPLLGAGSPSRGGEDLDIFVRIILSGGRLCYLPAALVWHRHRASDTALAEQIFDYGFGLGAYLAKRMMRGEVTVVTLVCGLGRLAFLAGRMRDATKASQFKGRGLRLAVSEAWGILVGAVRYWRIARQQRARMSHAR